LGSIDHEAENLRLKRELARVTEKRNILKKGEPWIATGSSAMANAYSAREAQ
jgi:transposase